MAATGDSELTLCDVASGSASLRVVAVGKTPASLDAGVFVFDRVKVEVKETGFDPVSTLLVQQQATVRVEVPVKLMVQSGDGTFRMRGRSELNGLAEEEWAALKDKLRRRLADPIALEVGGQMAGTVFGVTSVGGVAVAARFRLNAKLVDGFDTIEKNEWLLKADATAAIKFTYHQDANDLEIDGRFHLRFEIKKAELKDWIDLGLDFDLPELPGFDLKLPKISLPRLQFPMVSIPFEELLPSLFTLSLPPFIDKIAFAWNPNPKCSVALNQGDLSVSTSTPGSGILSYDNQAILALKDVTLSQANGKFDFSAKIEPQIQPITIAKGKKFEPPLMPFVFEAAEEISLKPSFANLDVGGGKVLSNAKLFLVLECKKLVIAAKDDPSNSIALHVAVQIDYDVNTRKTATQLTTLKVVEPYPVNLVLATVKQLGEMVRLIGAIPFPKFDAPDFDTSGVVKLLERLAKMLASAARWLAKQAGEAVGLLAGLIEAVLEAILQLLMKLARLSKEAAQEIVSHVAVEVRLDPKTYRLRQIIIMPVAENKILTHEVKTSALGFDFALSANLRPALVIDLGPESWTGIVVQAKASKATLGTDFWLAKETGPQQAISTTDEKTGAAGAASPRLIQLTATPVETEDKTAEIVLAAVQRGRIKLFQRFAGEKPGEKEMIAFDNRVAFAIRETGHLRDGQLQYNGEAVQDAVIDLTIAADGLKQRLLSLFAKAEASENAGDGFFDKLKQKIKITQVTPTFDQENTSAQISLALEVHIDDEFIPETQLEVGISLRDMSMKITGGDKIFIKGKDKTYTPLGMTLDIKKAKPDIPEPYKQFFLDLSHGNESLGLADEARAELSFGRVSTSGKGLQFDVPTFRVGRSGFDLEAKVLPEPVKLGGVDVPFRFTSGQISIKGSKFGGGSLAGAGQLPSALVGEANANIALQLGASSDGNVIVKAATARLDKSGDPIRCTSTRFDLTITELGFDYVYEGSYHFFFLITGSAVFKPGGNEYSTGLLKNLKDVTIKLDKAPLAADPRVLLRSISFQVKVDPPKKISFFDIFSFNLRGFGFHPASPKFNGDPAMSISGQVQFLKAGDKISSNIEFHGLWIARPAEGSSKPRVRFDGLTVGIRTGGVDVEGTAIAVDGSMPDLYRPGVLPANVTAEGFLASGKIDIDGWASMTAAMGFLELRKKGQPDPKHSFFLYGQVNKLATPIRTPVGTIYLREVGFGFGYRYTIAGINQAEQATSPQQLVKILDNVSKYQGSLHQFQAWEPTYDNSDLTLALRGMFALSAIEGGDYDEKREKGLPNPLLFDIVAAFRTDFTFLINLRAWVSVNYNDWVSSGLNEPWKSNPTMRGYLYFSVPRKEFLGRFVSDGTGYVGKHPELPKPLADAIAKTKFSATLYIRPGLFHAELGWPYELGVEFGKPSDAFYLSITGGLIHRIENASLLNGIAFKANGSVYLEGRVGSSSLGAAAIARANFAIEARVLSYLSLKDFGESFYYGYMRIDVAVHVSVEVWISFKIFGKRIRLSIGFSLHLAVSIALEAVVGPKGIGGRAHVSIGVRAFGRSLSVGIGFSFNNDKLADARAKVARFMELGLATQIPDQAQDGQRVETNPKPAPSRKEVAAIGDKIVEEHIGSEPPPRAPDEDDKEYAGRPILHTDFWAILYPTARPSDQVDEEDWYVMQLVPRDHTPFDNRQIEIMKHEEAAATYFAAPIMRQGNPLNFVGHEIELEAVIKLGKINAGQKTHWVTSTTIPCPTAVTEIVASEDGEKLVLGDLLGSLFLGETKGPAEAQWFDYQEPSARVVDLNLGKLTDSARTSAQELGQIGRGRTNLIGRQKREAEIEEARSAVVSAVVETAAAIAAQGQLPDETWPERRPNDVDARDFGLTFILNRSTIDTLFSGDAEVAPPTGRFKVRKSDTVPEGLNSAGHVHLFNHPDRMFRTRQPKFSPTHAIEQQGIKLNWDLEPAWGSSLGAYHDPEFHLKHYRIRRLIRGIPGNEYCAEFMVKAVSAMEYLETKEGMPAKVRFLRPEFQFVDDLRSQDQISGTPVQGIPEELRKLLLNQATREDLEELDLTPDAIDQLSVLYEIVPVDNAGTSDFGEVHLVTGFTLVETRAISPREVTLQVAYPGMPTHIASDDTAGTAKVPELLLLAKPAVVKSRNGEEEILWPETKQAFLVRVETIKVAPSGGYGADAIDDARRRPDQAAVDKMPVDQAKDFLLQVTDKNPILRLVAEHQPNEGPPKLVGLRGFKIEGRPDEVDISKLTGLKLPELLAALDVANKPAADAGKGHRVFLAAVHIETRNNGGQKEVAVLRRRGEWRTLSFNLVIKNADQKPPAITSVVEILEQPVHLEFAALKRKDMQIESGRVDVIQPSVGADLCSLLNDGDKAVSVVRDARRRTAMRLEWNARPNELALTRTTATTSDLHRWIGGFEIFNVDPDVLSATETELIDEVTELAQPLGRVSLLPPSMRGLDPAGFGDFGRIESAYPSDTLRLTKAPSSDGAGGVRKAGWYSAAETAAVFPQPSIRRSLVPDPDEGMIASLFAGGKPEAIRISFPGWDDAILPGWRLMEWQQHAKTWGEYSAARERFENLGEKDPKKNRFEAVLGCAETGKGPMPFDVPALRRLLQNLRLAPTSDSADESERAALARRLIDPSHLSNVTMRIEAIRFVGPKPAVARIVAMQELTFDLLPALHPIIADTLSFVQFDTWDAGGLKDANGKLYRRYAVSRDTDPDITTSEFAAYVDEVPSERDPHGWGALRALGLAAGFRLFDTETNDYVRFSTIGRGEDGLGKLIQAAFSRALERYGDGLRDNGQPFVDILTQPWGNVNLSWFDGGQRNPSGEEDLERLENEMLAVVQIALRPHPDRLAPKAGTEVSRVVRYYALTTDPKGAGRPTWKIELAPRSRDFCRVDVLSVAGGIVAQKPIRLDETMPAVDVFEPWPAVRIPGIDKRVVAIVRVVALQDLPKGWKPDDDQHRGLLVSAPPGREYFWEMVEQPRVIEAMGTQDSGPDIAFGKFENLLPEDWSDALFRPDMPQTEIYPHETVQRLAHYAGRRFAPLQLAVADVPEGQTPSPDQKREAADRRKDLADRVVRFWTRFVEHCAPVWGRRVDRSLDRSPQPDGIFFSLGTVADPGQYRRAPSEAGRVSVTLVDAERRGARRKLTVRPYGRYEAWSNAAPISVGVDNKPFIAEKHAGLEGAFSNLDMKQISALGTTYFVDTTLPRTDPLERPVILSSAIHQPEGKRPGRLELVVAHGSDMVLAQANKRNAALLAPLDISVGFWREFSHPAWLEWIEANHSTLKLRPLDPFGSLDQRLDVKKFELTRKVAEQRLIDLRERVPDAWLGSTMITATHLPYFFRMHALVHASAGIVVSEQATTTFEEGFYQLGWPHVGADYAGRVLAEPHHYSIDRRYVPAQPDPSDPNSEIPAREITVISFDIAATRFIDCMIVEDAKLWFGATGEYWTDELRRVAHLPEPGVNYRIAVETPLRITETGGDGHLRIPMKPAVDSETKAATCSDFIPASIPI